MDAFSSSASCVRRSTQRLLLGASVLVVSGAIVLAADAPPAPQEAPEEPSELAKAFWYDSERTIHLRSYYANQLISPPPTGPAAGAAGGWLGYKSGWLSDAFRVGIVGYTSLRLWAPADRNGTLLLLPDRDSYAVVGEAYGQIKIFDQVFTGYRQRLDEPEVNIQDNRMTPNTFEAYMLQGRLGDFSYIAGYVDRIKPRNENQFFNMAYQAGAPAGVSEGMWLGRLSYSPFKELTARVSSYTVPDILTSTYTDVVFGTPLSEDVKAQVSGQYMYQSSNGADLLTGSSFNAWGVGVKGDLSYGPVTGTIGYTKMGKDASYRSPYGSWAGYTAMIVKDFYRANESGLLVGATLDFAPVKLPGMSLTASFVFGDNAINPSNGLAASKNTEYDFTLDYRFNADYWPEYLKPLWLRARYAYVTEKQPSGSTTPDTRIDDYRVILNYEWVFGKK